MGASKEVMDKVNKVLSWAKSYRERGLWADGECVEKAMYNPACLGRGDKDWRQVRKLAEKYFKEFCEREKKKDKEFSVEKGEKPSNLKKETKDPRVIEGGLFGENFGRK